MESLHGNRFIKKSYTISGDERANPGRKCILLLDVWVEFERVEGGGEVLRWIGGEEKRVSGERMVKAERPRVEVQRRTFRTRSQRFSTHGAPDVGGVVGSSRARGFNLGERMFPVVHAGASVDVAVLVVADDWG